MAKSFNALALAAGVILAAPAHAAVVYSNNFDAAPGVAAGVTAADNFSGTEAATAGAWNADGWSGIYSVNRTTGNPAGLTSLTLSGLQANSAVTIDSAIFGFLESWDSTDGGCCSPDYVDIFINGVLVASLTANNALGTVELYGGATELYDGVQVNANGYYSDTLVDFSTAGFANSFADGAGNWTFGIQASGAGWQGGSDEAWGIDDIQILGTVAQGVVPEPSAWALIILGFGAAGAAMRRKHRSYAAPQLA